MQRSVRNTTDIDGFVYAMMSANNREDWVEFNRLSYDLYKLCGTTFHINFDEHMGGRDYRWFVAFVKARSCSLQSSR